jgi:hypothetical protein
MMANNTQKDKATQMEQTKDEDVGIMIYGNVKIRDIDTGKILVNQRA